MSENKEENKKYREYSKNSIVSAIKDIQENGLKVGTAAKKYNVPRSTLNRHLSVDVVNPSGRKQVISAEYENELVEWALHMDKVGQGLTKQEFLEAAGKVSNLKKNAHKFVNDAPSKSWLVGFMRRHPEIAFRRQSYLSHASACVSEQDLRKFYAKIYEYLEANDLLYLLDQPDRWINGDETNFLMNAVPKKVLSKKGKKVVYRQERSKPKESVTGMYAFSAEGYMFKPMYILNEQTCNLPEIANACIDVGAKFAFVQTPSGWQTKETFTNYVKDHLYPEILEKGTTFPLVLVVDGHSSHLSFDLYKWCRDHQIIYIVGYPNSTHITQPCDTSIFGPVKNMWPIELQKYEKEVGRNVTLVDFIKIVKRLHDKVIKKESIINGFRMTGLFPLNVENIHFDRCIAVGIEETLVDELMDDATVIANHDGHEVQILNEPIINQSLVTPTADWNTALENPFIIDDSIAVNVDNFNSKQKESLDSILVIKENLQKLRLISQEKEEERPEILSTIISMEHMCDFIFVNISNNKNEPLKVINQPNFDNSTIVDLVRKPDDAEIEQSVDIHQILKRAPPPERSKKHRKYGKLPKFGVMSSDEVVKQYEDDMKEKEEFKNKKLERQALIADYQAQIVTLQTQIKNLRLEQKKDNHDAKNQKSKQNGLQTKRGRKVKKKPMNRKNKQNVQSEYEKFEELDDISVVSSENDDGRSEIDCNLTENDEDFDFYGFND